MTLKLQAGRSLFAWALLVSIISIGLLADLYTKRWSFETVAGTPVQLNKYELITNQNLNPIPPHSGIIAIPWNILDFRLVLNSGAVFGLGSNQRILLLLLTLFAISIALFAFSFYLKKNQYLNQIALGLIISGGMGNFYDRLIFGRVRDFLYLFPTRELPFGIRWPGGSSELFPWIFNIADVLLIIGMTTLLITSSKDEQIKNKTTN